jgi:rhodanese-related sulfurtransferase
MRLPGNPYRLLAAAALTLGGLAAFAGSPVAATNARVDVATLARTVEREDDHVTAIELARWIRDKRQGLRIVDIRDSASFRDYHIPGAERIELAELVATPFRHEETIVLYSDGGAHAAQGWVFLRALGYTQVYFLRGGLYEWLDQVMNPSIAENATDSARNEFKSVSEISRYFGGVPRVGDPVSSQPSISVPVKKESGDARAATAVARVRGRGC